VDWLRGLDAADLRDVLALRADAAVGNPCSLPALADALSTPSSLRSAVDGLDRACRDVLGAVLLLGAGASTGSVAQALRCNGKTARAELKRALARLRARALVWPEGERLRAAAGLRAPDGEPPERLALPPRAPRRAVRGDGFADRAAAGPALSTVDGVTRLVGFCDSEVVAARNGVGVRELRRIAGVLRTGEAHVRLWLELAVGARLLAVAVDDRRVLPTTASDGWLGAAPADRLVRLATAWPLMAWPPAKTRPALTGQAADRGGATRRGVLRRHAELGADEAFEHRHEVVADLAWSCPAVHGPADAEAALAEAEAVGLVALGALTSLGRAVLAGVPGGAAVARCGAGAEAGPGAGARADVVALLPGGAAVGSSAGAAGLPVGAAAGLPAGLSMDAAAGLSAGLPDGVAVGVSAGLSADAAAGLPAGLPDGVAAGLPVDAVMGVPAGAVAFVPPAASTVDLRPDLTAAVAGLPSRELGAVLDLTADRVAGGWRFSGGSVRRALDAGHAPGEVLARLAEVAEHGVPRALEHLVHEVARRHGGLSVTAVGCCVRADDPQLLAEIARHPSLTALGLRPLGPTVLASERPADETLALLRTAGYTPGAAAADGSPVVRRAPRRRVEPARTPPWRPWRPPLTDRELTGLAAALVERERPAPEAVPPRTRSRWLDAARLLRDQSLVLRDSEVVLLADALVTRSAVEIAVAKGPRTTIRHVITPVDHASGSLTANGPHGESRQFLVGHIRSVRPVR